MSNELKKQTGAENAAETSAQVDALVIRQKFLCEKCGLTETAEINTEEGVWAAVAKIKQVHDEWMPECLFDRDRIKLVD